jgi:hypothetical protein
MNRRSLFTAIGMAGLLTAAPAAAVVAMHKPGRRVTRLPNGGSLIEDETFTTGIKVENCQNLSISHCVVDVRPDAERSRDGWTGFKFS